MNSDIAEQFGKMIAQGMQRQAELREKAFWEAKWAAYGEEMAKKYADKSDDEMKALWDNSDGTDDIDEYHFELNRRGLGEYCAV